MTIEGRANYQVSDDTTVGEALFVVPGAAEIFKRHGCEAEFECTQEHFQALLAAGVADPSIGLYSDTDQAHGVTLNQMIFDRVLGIAAGHAPMSDLDQLVKDWRSQGGDSVREEFQKAAEAA
jgi:putative aldouronate transport system substrate-binding protein